MAKVLDSYERRALRRSLRRLRAAIVDHRQYNNGEHPAELKVSPSTFLLLRSAELVDDESYCERFKTRIGIG